MNLKIYHYVFILLILLAAGRVLPFDIIPTEIYRPDNWAGVSFGVGAAILTLVGIITSIVISNENNRLGEFVENLNLVLGELKEKSRINPDRRLIRTYEIAVQKLESVIDERSPLGYSDGIIGLVSFFCFLISAILALESIEFRWVYYSFLLGIALLVGYVVYIILQFLKIDGFSHIPKKDGKISLLSIRINGQHRQFDIKNNEIIIRFPKIIRRVEFGVRFKGKIRNGFFHAIIRYTNNRSSHIPEPNTYLGNTVFANAQNLVISSDKRLDTGILQGDEPIELVFEVCKDIEENPPIGSAQTSLGIKEIHQYCSIPKGYHMESIELRVYEDPLYKSSYKRREIDLIKVINQQIPED